MSLLQCPAFLPCATHSRAPLVKAAAHYRCCRALSQLLSPGPPLPYKGVRCLRAPSPLAISPALHRVLLHPYRTTGPQPWFVPVEVIITGPGSGSVPLRETMRALLGLRMFTFRTRLHRHHLHWPLLLYQRRLRLLSPHQGNIRPGWDLGPLLQCIRDHVGGPHLPSGLGHQARVSLRGLGPSRRLLHLMRVRHPSNHRPRGSGALCSAAIRSQGMSICMPETSMGSHTMTYRYGPRTSVSEIQCG